MAEPLLPVGVPEYQERLMRALDIKGDIPQELRAQLQPVFVAEDFTQPEFFWLKRGRSFQCFSGVAAVAGQNPVVELQAVTGNPDVLAVIDRIIISNPGAAAITVRFGLNTVRQVAGAVTPTATDERQLGQAAAYRVFTGNVVYANNAAQMGFDLATRQSAIIPGPWILSGFGTGAGCFGVYADALNVGLQVGVSWRERQLYQTER
jgi:hypothetical protein